MTSRFVLRAGSAAISAALALTLAAGPTGAAPSTTSASDAQSEAKRVNVRPGLYEGRFRTSTGRQLEDFRFRVTKDRKVRQFAPRWT